MHRFGLLRGAWVHSSLPIITKKKGFAFSQSHVSSEYLASSFDHKEFEEINQNIQTVSWVQSIRKQKHRTFFDVNDGSSSKNLQVVCRTEIFPEGVVVGSAVSVLGHLVHRPLKTPNRQQPVCTDQISTDHCASETFTTDLIAQSVRLLSNPVGRAKAKEDVGALFGAMSSSRPNLGLLRSERGLSWRHRLPEMAAMLRLRAGCKSVLRDVMQQHGYLEVDTPILTTSDCEGAGETFLVRPSSANLDASAEDNNFQTPLHLTVSAQLHLEVLTLGMGRVYTLGPTFRAEPSHSRFHLAEFLMLEAESVDMTCITSLCDAIEALVRSLLSTSLTRLSTKSLLPDLSSVISYLGQKSVAPEADRASAHLDTLLKSLEQPFARVPFADVVTYLQRQGCHTTTTTNGSLSKEEEHLVCRWATGCKYRPVFITHFPATMKPFYCAHATEDDSKAAAVDLLVPELGELVGGSVRETDEDRLKQKMALQGIQPASMAWYTSLRGHGSAPHGGFGLGFDRLLMWLMGVDNIRDTVPFPREIKKMYL